MPTRFPPEAPQGRALRRDVESALQAKGYSLSEDPAILVRLNGVVNDSYTFSNKKDNVERAAWEYEGSGSKKTAEGILVLEALTSSGEELLWAGIGRSKVSTQSPDKTLKKSRELLKKILKEFPAR